MRTPFERILGPVLGLAVAASVTWVAPAPAQTLQDLLDGKVEDGADPPPIPRGEGDQRGERGADGRDDGLDEGRGDGRVGPPPPPDDRVTPPPPPPPDGTEYYYTAGGANYGPYSLADMKGLVADGRVTRATQIWREGLAGWTPITDEPTLAALLADGAGDAGRWKTFLLGTWGGEGESPPLTYSMQTTYFPDGTFRTVTSYYTDDLLNPGNKVLLGTLESEGTWETKPMSGSRFQVTLAITKVSDPTVMPDRTPKSYVVLQTGPDSLTNESDKSKWRRLR